MVPQDFTAKSYDFIIIGGGTAGLALAARLTEDPNVSVGVLEAGESHLQDPITETPGLFLQLLDKPQYDWAFKTTPQKHANARVHFQPRGKGLGGSSGINFMMFSNPSKQDLDNFAELGNPGWAWDDLAPYFRKFEKYNALANKDQKTFDESYIDPLLRGTDGPIQVSFPRGDYNWVQAAWPATCRNIGYPQPSDPRSGSAIGGFNQLMNMDPKTATRSYSATAYYAANSGRANLSVLTGALVERISVDDNNSSDSFHASGVEFSVDGTAYHVRAKREVIVCAGALQSPQILELSGIGSRSVLEKHHIKVQVDNPNVGENLFDHLLAPLTVEVENEMTAESMKRDPSLVEQAMEQYKTSQSGPFANGSTCAAFVPYHKLLEQDEISNLNSYVDKLSATSTLSETQLRLLRQQILNPNEAALQICAFPLGCDIGNATTGSAVFTHNLPGNYITLTPSQTRPFSRGTVHINSPSASDPPTIDPCYLSNELDLDILARGLLHAQKLVQTEPLASKLKDGGRAIAPNLLPLNNLEDARNIVRNQSHTQYHPVGTCAMLPQVDGGVVGPDLKVYGTRNVRVVDASVFPMLVQGNIQSTVYAFAEKAADIIKDHWKGRGANGTADGVGSGMLDSVLNGVTNGVAVLGQ